MRASGPCPGAQPAVFFALVLLLVAFVAAASRPARADDLPLPPSDTAGQAVETDSSTVAEDSAAVEVEGDDASAAEVPANSDARELPPDTPETDTPAPQYASSLRELDASGAATLEAEASAALDEAEARLRKQSGGLLTFETVPAGPQGGRLPDNFSAGRVETDRYGRVFASGGVQVTVSSVLSQGSVEVQSDSALYDPASGVLELSGNVSFSLSGLSGAALSAGKSSQKSAAPFDPRYFSGGKLAAAAAGDASQLTLHCDWLSIDPVMQRTQVRGLRVMLSLEELLGPETVKQLPLRTDFRNHLLPGSPRSMYLSAGEVNFSQGVRSTGLSFEQIKLSLGARPDPDLFITAQHAELGADDRIIFRDIQLHISGFNWIRWPRLGRSLKPRGSTFSFDTPQFQIDREFGLAVKQGATVDLGVFKTNALVDYSPEYGALVQGYAYLEPVVGTEIGVQAGRSTLSNIKRDTVQRRDDYNFVYKQLLHPGHGVQSLRLGAQYGQIHEKIAGRPNIGLPDHFADDQRLMGDLDFQLSPVDLGSNLYLTAGGRARLIRYEDADVQYRVLGGRAGLVWRHDGFDHFVLYRYNNTDGTPIFSFDEVRREQLDFATALHPLPDWRNVVRGSYDPLREDFDRLQVGALKQQKSYELGVFWDFARESAELQFGLRID